MKGYNLAVVGATGLVGSTFIKLLEEYDFPVCSISFFASEGSEGKKIKFLDKEYLVERVTLDSFKGMDFVFFFTSTSISKKWVPIALDEGCYVIDNSSCFRLDENYDLIIPEVNFDSIRGKLISNPNCSVIQMAIVLDALKELGMKKIVCSTYQSVSGSGKKGIDALVSGEASIYKYNVKETCIPLVGELLPSGYSDEEEKVINELQRLFGYDIEVYPTCVRVPILYSHGVSLTVSFDKDFTVSDIITLLNKSNSIKVVDVPTSTLANKNDYVYVGRIRKNNDAVSLYVVANNLRRGAALNSLFIALKIISNSIAYKI